MDLVTGHFASPLCVGIWDVLDIVLGAKVTGRRQMCLSGGILKYSQVPVLGFI